MLVHASEIRRKSVGIQEGHRENRDRHHSLTLSTQPPGSGVERTHHCHLGPGSSSRPSQARINPFLPARADRDTTPCKRKVKTHITSHLPVDVTATRVSRCISEVLTVHINDLLSAFPRKAQIQSEILQIPWYHTVRWPTASQASACFLSRSKKWRETAVCTRQENHNSAVLRYGQYNPSPIPSSKAEGYPRGRLDRVSSPENGPPKKKPKKNHGLLFHGTLDPALRHYFMP